MLSERGEKDVAEDALLLRDITKSFPGVLANDQITLQVKVGEIHALLGENGAGKSSILDAITWSLWGKARSNSPDELIHQGETEMRVAITFLQGEDRFRVIRQRKAGKRGSSVLEFQVWDQLIVGGDFLMPLCVERK